jgi:hypothetical protein
MLMCDGDANCQFYMARRLSRVIHLPFSQRGVENSGVHCSIDDDE